MAFTYDLSSATLAIAQLSEVRFEIGDTVENSGVLPNKANLQDDEITLLLDREGSILGAVAAASETLSRRWALSADVQSDGASKRASQISKQWAARADRLRAQLGGSVGGGAGTVNIQARRVDGYSDL